MKTELHERLSLTGAEISVNELPAGANVPFVHSHKQNEEIYGILSGRGKAVIDGEDVTLATGDWLKISPAAKRQFFAASDSGITYICIQVKENSLYCNQIIENKLLLIANITFSFLNFINLLRTQVHWTS